MNWIKTHNQECVAILIIALFWIAIGISNELKYEAQTVPQHEQQVAEETGQTPAPSDTPLEVPTQSPVQ